MTHGYSKKKDREREKERKEGRNEERKEERKKNTGENWKLETTTISHNPENDCQSFGVAPSGRFLFFFLYLLSFRRFC